MTEEYGAGENWNTTWVLISSAPHLSQILYGEHQDFTQVSMMGSEKLTA
jgi:hypothetical protein